MPKLSERHLSIYQAFLAKREGLPFRKQDLVAALLPSIRAPKTRTGRPSRRDLADDTADALIKADRRAGRLEKAGHVHWKQAGPQARRAKSGRLLERSPTLVSPELSTHYPSKYAIIDLETGDAWGIDKSGQLKRLPDNLRAEIPPVAAVICQKRPESA